MEYMAHVTFRCTAELKRQIRIEAAKRDQNYTEFIIAVLTKEIQQLTKNKEG